MKSKTISIFLASMLATMLTTMLILQIDSQKTLGSSSIEGTSLRCQVSQSRSISNRLGIGATKIWFSVIDSKGTWIQTQRIYIFGKEKNKWAEWNAPKVIQTEARDTLTIVPIELNFSSGKVYKNDVVVGIN